MSSAFAIAETDTPLSELCTTKAPVKSLRVQAFSSGHQDEVLAFLAHRPIHTVFMSGLIRDNGLVSFGNRGTFYGCRNNSGHLTGVALVGLKTVIEARDQTALEVLGELIPNNLRAHLVRGEKEQVAWLLQKYAETGRLPRQLSNELLLEQVAPVHEKSESNLRLAVRDDLASIVTVNAALGLEETGVDPLTLDRQGMLYRTSRRVEQGRVWVLIENGRLIFKADIISETPEAAFIEGVYVQPDARRLGYASRCMTQLARNLLVRVPSICLVVNEANAAARAFYDKVGYQVRSSYNTAYFSAS
jgi:predicted GNAT family acetyltransferase